MMACASSSPDPQAVADPEAQAVEAQAEQADSAVDASGFSGTRAFGFLEGLGGEPRVAGTEGAERAREQIEAALEELGLEVHRHAFMADESVAGSGGAVELVNLGVALPGTPGAGADLLLLATPYDSAPGEGVPGANEGASGAALLLELARALQVEPLPYSTRLVWLDGELMSDEAPWLGSRALVRSLIESGQHERVRLVVYLHQVADQDLEVSRDLRSHRVFREKIFRAAERAGYASAFPADRLFDDVPGGHRVFEQARFRRFVALVDPRMGEGEAPGSRWRTPQDDVAHCSAESLEAVGRSLHQGLVDISQLLEKVDRFSSWPEPEPAEEPTDGVPRDEEPGAAPDSAAEPPATPSEGLPGASSPPDSEAPGEAESPAAP